MTVTHVCKKNDAVTGVRITKLHSYSSWEIRPTEDAEEYANFDAIEISFCPFCGIKLADLIKEEKKLCSICGQNLSECIHYPGVLYGNRICGPKQTKEAN